MISTPSHNLPVQLLPIIGREIEMAELMDLLTNPECRLVTIHGFGGSGKTRLASEVGRFSADRFEDGVWFVNLAPLDSADHILTTAASVLGFEFGSSIDHKQQLFRYLKDKKLLLILDNMEHLLPDAALLLENFLQNTDRVSILVTSRQPLNTPWEWAYLLRGLDVQKEQSDSEGNLPAAVELFLQQLRRSGRSVEVGDAVCAGQISRLVNGLPLALILAANWGRTLGCEEIFTEIQRGLGFLQKRGQTSSDKHGSMQAVFDYSWRLLTDREQATLCKLSVFRGSFDRSAASELAGADLTTIASLVDQVLIERVENNRYQIHELLRQYLQDRLVEMDQDHLTRDAHLDYYTKLAKQAEPELFREQQVLWIDRLKIEIDNLGAALEWSLENQDPIRLWKGLDMLTATERLWTLPLLTTTGADFLVRLLASFPADHNPRLYAKGLILAGWLAYLLEDLPASRQFTNEAYQIGMSLDDQRLVADAYYVQSLETFYRKDFKTGQRCAQGALDAYQKINFEIGITRALDSLGRCESYSGNSAEAMQHITAALVLSKKLGDVRTQYSTLRALGEVTAQDPQKLHQARAYFQESLQYARLFNDKFYTGHILNYLAEIEREQGQFEPAIPFYQEAIAIEKELGRQDELMIDEQNLAFVYCRLGRYDEAREIFIRNLQFAMKSDHLGIEITTCLLGLATIAVAEGQPDLAAKALGAIDATKQPLIFWATDRKEYERTNAATKAVLGDHAYEKFFREGKALGEAGVGESFLNPISKEQTKKVALNNQLTRRELEILRLVAHGLSDAQVAERLVLSPRTVNAHLTSIYQKLEVNSRTAATRIAIDQGLV